MAELELIATSTFGLEAIVARELEALGYESKTIQPGRMLFSGDAAALCRANLWLRAADRVLLRLGSFEATDFGQLFDGTHALPWEEWIPADGAFPVRGRSIKSQLSSVPACQKIVKKAIVEKLRAAHGVETLEETGPQFTVAVALLEDQVTLTLDTTGPGLHKRGYRTLAGKAPLKETLAAAMVMLSFWGPERPLIDPFCGTGTIPIEAAMIGRNLAPGFFREFAAEQWPCVPASVWADARQEARDVALPELPERIIGTDVDAEALSLARYHADQAGVGEQIHFQQKAFADLSSKREYGCLIANPPYGQRIGERDEIRRLYEVMPDVLRRLKTWSHYILTSHPSFEKLVGQTADRRRKLFNGRIECTKFQYYGPKPGTTIERRQDDAPDASVPEPPAPAFGGLRPEADRQVEEFRNRLAKRARHLRRWPTKQGITCYRLYDRDVPEVPLVIDRYEQWLHVSEYERPHERTPAEHADWLDLMIRTIGDVLDVSASDIFFKRRRRQRGNQQHERYDERGEEFVVHEAGLKFLVNLSDYVDTGLFLDHRITRGMVRDAAGGKHFLNLFGYTGAFSVYAAAGGAASTTTVDLSNTYVDWAGRNLSVNGFHGDQHHCVASDAMTFLKRLRGKPTYDLAVVDPPTFSNSKRTEDFWDVQRDYVELLNTLLPLITPGGVVYFSTNFRRFKFDEAAIDGVTIREISRQTVPPDYRNQRIHRCWRLVRWDR